MNTEPLGWAVAGVAVGVILALFVRVYLEDRKKKLERELTEHEP